MKGGLYLPGDDASGREKLRDEWKNNVEFYPTEYSSSTRYFKPCMLLAVWALQKLKYAEDQFVKFRNTYKSELNS